MPRTARRQPESAYLKTVANQRRDSFAVETDVRKLAAIYDGNQNKACVITVSKTDWELLTEGRSHMAHTGYIGAHKLVVIGLIQ